MIFLAQVLISAFLLLAALWLLLLLWLAVKSRRPARPLPAPEEWPRFLVIVPAHDEEAMIHGTVERILALDYPKDYFSLYVVADNCSDRTAELARAAGARCLERADKRLLGKGYALDFALRELAGEPADAVLFLDADSFPRPDYLQVMARHLAAGEEVIQGRYEARSLEDTWFTRLTAMSFILRNRWVFPALTRLGWPIPLRGSGMCFARGIIGATGWSAHGLTEDLEMTLELVRGGRRISYAAGAVSGQYMPSTPHEAVSQRRRWSAGGSQIRRTLLTRDLPAALKAGQWGRSFVYVYLAMPSLSAQLAALTVAAAGALFLGPLLAVAALGLLILYGAYFSLGLPRLDGLSLKAWLMIPVYSLWRIFWGAGPRKGPQMWVRTDRPAAPAEARRLRISMLGTRGVPANYGGFETCVEEVGARLAAKGHEVTVYCRTHMYSDQRPDYRGMRLVYLPALRRRSLETVSHTALSALRALFRDRADVFLAFNVANALPLFLLRLKRVPLALNTDGLEWKRGKWSPMLRKFFKISERLGTWVATRIITDSRAMAEYYQTAYHAGSATIAYGAETVDSVRPGLLDKFGLRPREYFLQITRFEPENNPLLTARAFLELQTDKKLVLVGGAGYEGPYQRELAGLAGDRVILPGFIYDQDLLRELWCNCHAYVHGNEVGGTNPALLQAMAHSSFVIARDVIFNREVLGDCGRFFAPTKEALLAEMRWTLERDNSLLDEKRRAARDVITRRYNWDDIASQYEAVCLELARRS